MASCVRSVRSYPGRGRAGKVAEVYVGRRPSRDRRWNSRAGAARAKRSLLLDGVRLAPRSCRPSRAVTTLDEVDDQGAPLRARPGAQTVLGEVGIVARDPHIGGDLNREARRALSDLSHVEELEAVLARAAAGADGRLARLDGLGEEAVELGSRDASGQAITER